MKFIRLLAVSSVIFLVSIFSWESAASAASRQIREADAALTVHVSDASGGPLLLQAIVTLSSPGGGGAETQPTHQGGVASFTRVNPGDYTILVSAAGYQTASQDVTLSKGGASEAFISLTKSGQAVGAKPYPGVPLVTGKAKKELDAALKALQENQVAAANSHITIALKSAPANPDVQYVAGMCAQAENDMASAQKHFESAISIYPGHVFALVALSGLLLQKNDAAAAVPHLEKAVEVDPNNWRAQWMLAEALLSANNDAANGKLHATRAIELGGEKAVDAEVTLARAEIMAGERDAAHQRLEKFIQEYPDHPNTPRARQMLHQLEVPPSGPPQAR